MTEPTEDYQAALNDLARTWAQRVTEVLDRDGRVEAVAVATGLVLVYAQGLVNLGLSEAEATESAAELRSLMAREMRSACGVLIN